MPCLALGPGDFPGFRSECAASELLAGAARQIVAGLFCRAWRSTDDRQWRFLCRRLLVGGIVSRDLRNDRIFRLRRFSLFDWLPCRLGGGPVRDSRTAEETRALYVCRRTRQQVWFTRHQDYSRHQYLGREYLLPDSADGWSWRADQAFARYRATLGSPHRGRGC